MSTRPRPAAYYAQRRTFLIRQHLCVYGASHGPALPMLTICGACQERIRTINRRRNPMRKRKGES